MKLLYNLMLTLALAITFFACTEIIEPNISNDVVVLLAPANNLHTSITTQTFWWQQIEFADQYQLQVVSPEFIRIERLILDTIITDDKFSWSLTPGIYQWRVRGMNYSYNSEFTITSVRNISFERIIDLSYDLLFSKMMN